MKGRLLLAVLPAVLVSCLAARNSPPLVPVFPAPAVPAPQPPQYGKEHACICEGTATAVWRLAGVEPANAPMFFVSGLTIDADGAPNAYHKANVGLDHIDNARQYPNRKPDEAKGKWVGVVTDEAGRPVVQGPEDPCPGFYVSPTSLCDVTYGVADPRRYVDAVRVPYVALPPSPAIAELGDFCIVVNLRNGRRCGAIVADRCRNGRAGEGSVRLAELLGINANARHGGIDGEVLTIVFPHSGNERPRSLAEIETESSRLLASWGGIQSFEKLLATLP